MKEDQLFCVTQKVVIEKDGKVLVLNDPLMGIDLPGGKIQEGEVDFDEALRREVREETGLEITIGELIGTGYFEVPMLVDGQVHRNAGKKIFQVYYKAKHVGGEIQLSDEHDIFEWVDKDSYQAMSKGYGENIMRILKHYFAKHATYQSA